MTITKIKNYFDNISSSYDKNFLIRKSSSNFTFRRRLHICSSILNNKKGNIIDIAIGSGDITKKIIENNNFEELLALDISKRMLIKSKKKLKYIKKTNIKYFQKDFMNYKALKKFDFILAMGILAHTNNNNLFFDQINKLAKKNSIVILQFSDLNFITVKLKKYFFKKRYFRKYGYNINFSTKNEIDLIIKRKKFKILKIYKYSLSFPFLDKVFPYLNYYIEVFFEKFFKNIGEENIYVLKKI